MEQYLKYVECNLGKRIYSLLRRLEPSDYESMAENAYTESLLSREVKEYFAYLAANEPAQAEEIEQESFLYQACRIFALDDFERMCLELMVLGELNPYFEKFFIYMNNDWNAGYLTPDIAVRLYTLDIESRPEFYAYFEKEARLTAFFIHVCTAEEKSWLRSGLRCRRAFLSLIASGKFTAGSEDDLTLWYGQNIENEQFPSFEMPVFYKLDRILTEGVTACLGGMGRQEGIALVKQYAFQRQKIVCFFNICQLAESFIQEKEGKYKELCMDIIMQAIWQKACICAYAPEQGFMEKEQNRMLIFWLSEHGKKYGIPLLFLGEGECLKTACPDIWEISLEKGENRIDAALWKKLAEKYPVDGDISWEFYANTYDFSYMQAVQVLKRADRKRILDAGDTISRQDIRESCIQQTKSERNHLFTIIDTGYSMEDLVLPKQQLQLLKAACNRVRCKDVVYRKWGFDAKLAYGRGVAMVFSGPPGTGKTMSAGIIADILGTALYKVNLAGVVSKYIGETEKNLHVIFKAVEEGHGVLFFDEADVLFGKRTQVKDSNDKHSNMETAYLLQKIEEYEGVVILATNYIQNMDEAFKRRIPFFIEFPFPDAEHRKRLWEKVFPEQTEFGEKPDYDFLARQFELSGSHIKNIAIQAAFLAAGQEQGVRMEHIIQALLEEMKKTGRRISYEDLQEYSIYY